MYRKVLSDVLKVTWFYLLVVQGWDVMELEPSHENQIQLTNLACFFIYGSWLVLRFVLFGTIVLSKVNVLLGLLLWVYALRREVLVISGCHLGDTIGEWFILEDEVPFGSLVNVVDGCIDGWLPRILLLKLSMVRDDSVLDSMEC